MKYMGSKARYAKELLPIILSGAQPGQVYVEPFVGGANMIDKAPATLLRIANDKNHYIIALYQALQAGWIPPEEVSEAEFRTIRFDKEAFPPYLVGFAGIACCYGGRWFKGYQRGENRDGTPRRYVAETRSALLKQLPRLKDVLFVSRDYRDLFIAGGSIVYCDPPYVGAVAPYVYRVYHDEFWRWCDSLVVRGCRVYVSEYNAPPHWTCVWKKEVGTSLGERVHGETVFERLFTTKA